MLTLAKIGIFLLDNNLSWEANFQRSPLLLEHEHLHDGHGRILEDRFGMGDVKVVGGSVRGASHARSPTLSLRRIDPYWRSQILVEYSKDLGACMILDDPNGEERYMVDDVVIYCYGRIFLTRVSSLKEKLLHAAHEEFLAMLVCTLMHILSC